MYEIVSSSVALSREDALHGERSAGIPRRGAFQNPLRGDQELRTWNVIRYPIDSQAHGVRIHHTVAITIIKIVVIEREDGALWQRATMSIHHETQRAEVSDHCSGGIDIPLAACRIRGKGGPNRLTIRYDLRDPTPIAIVAELWYCYGRQDSDNGQGDHQLNEGKTGCFCHG